MGELLQSEVGALLALFVLNLSIPRAVLRELFSTSEVSALADARLVELDGRVARARLNLVPCGGFYVVSDRISLSRSFNQVMYPFPETHAFVAAVERGPAGVALDLCTGTGIHALAASRHCRRVIGLDVSRRAVAFSRFNAALNQVQHIEFAVSDVYSDRLARGPFDLVTANPPYNPHSSRAGSNFYSGGPTGEAILSRVIAGVPGRLSPAGCMYLVTLLVHSKQETYRDKLDRWLGGHLREHDVVIQAYPLPSYPDSPAAQGRAGGRFAGFEFGFISIRRTPPGERSQYRHLRLDTAAWRAGSPGAIPILGVRTFDPRHPHWTPAPAGAASRR